MLLLTEPGDTAASIACRILDKPDESYAKKFHQMNKDTLAYTSIEGDSYIPDQLVWCPDFSELDNHPVQREIIQNETNFIPSKGKANISKLQNANIDMNNLIATSKIIKNHNQTKQDENPAIISGMVARAGIESFSRSIEHAFHPAEKFSESMSELNNSLSRLLKAKKSGSKDAVRMARQRFKEIYQYTMENLAHDTKLYKNRLSLKTGKILPSANRLEKLATKKGIMVYDLEDVRVLEKIARYGHWAGRACYLFSIGLGAREVVEAYKEDQDWIAKAVGVSAEIGAAWLLGKALLFFTPAGWVALVGTAILEGAIIATTGQGIEKQFEDLAAWGEETLTKWL